MKIQATKEYGQFKTILGNRAVDMNHVNYLVKLNSKENLLWQFPADVTKDGYLWDGQHRLEACRANDWEFYYTVSTKTLAELSDDIVAKTNTAQKRWTMSDYITFFAAHKKEQYVFLQELMKEYKLSHAIILRLSAGKSRERELKLGILILFTTDEEKAVIEELCRQYIELRGTIPTLILSHSPFAAAMRTVFKDFNAQEIKQAVDRMARAFSPQRTVKDYLREMEEIINYKKHEKNYIRFF